MDVKSIARAARDRGGFTLVEVLVTAAVLGVLLTSVLGIFNAQQKTYTVQTAVSDMQQNGRAALGILARDIRSGGFGVPNEAALLVVNSNSAPDSITVTGDYAGGESTEVLTHNKASKYFTVASGVYGADAVGSEMMLFDDSDYHAVTVSAFTSGATDRLDYDTSSSPINYSVGQNKDYTGGTATTASPRTYQIDTSIAGRPRLMRGGAVIAEDIEDLQIAYGLDADGDGVVEAWSSAPSDATEVRLVRVSLIARSAAPDPNWNGSRPGLEDRPPAGAADGYRRMVLQTTEMIRNLPL